MNFQEARIAEESNKKLIEFYNFEQERLTDYLNSILEDVQEIDEILERKIGICDYYRLKYPERIKTDEEIIQHYEILEDKYEGKV